MDVNNSTSLGSTDLTPTVRAKKKSNKISLTSNFFKKIMSKLCIGKAPEPVLGARDVPSMRASINQSRLDSISASLGTSDNKISKWYESQGKEPLDFYSLPFVFPNRPNPSGLEMYVANYVNSQLNNAALTLPEPLTFIRGENHTHCPERLKELENALVSGASLGLNSALFVGSSQESVIKYLSQTPASELGQNEPVALLKFECPKGSKVALHRGSHLRDFGVGRDSFVGYATIAQNQSYKVAEKTFLDGVPLYHCVITES